MEATTSSYGFSDLIIKNLPGNVAEYDLAAGREGACFETALSGFLAHTHLTRYRAELIPALEKATGIEREHELKDGVKKYTEKDGTYMKRLEAELSASGRDLYEEFAPLAQQVMDSVEVNLAGRVRGATSIGRPAQKWIDAAGELVKIGKLELFANKYGIELSDDVIDSSGELTEAGENLIGNKLRVLHAEAKKRMEEQLKNELFN